MNYSYVDKNKEIERLSKRSENNRAASFGPSDESNNSFETRTNQKQNTASSNKQNTALIWEPKHVAFLDQHIFLGESAKIQETYNFINDQLTVLSDDLRNHREFPEEYKMVGYHLDETREGCYRIQLFSYNDKLGVNCTRLNGDSLALCSLWGKLKQALHEGEYYVDKFLVEGELEDDDEIFGDDDDDDLDRDSFLYLDFSRDEAFVSKMIADINDVNVGTHALMLLKFNFEKESNLSLVSGTQKFSQDLVDKTIERLSGNYVTLPVAVCAANILKKLLCEAGADVEISSEQLDAIIAAADSWCYESNTSRTITPTASEEASLYLTELIDTAKGLVTEDLDEMNIQQKIQRIQDKTHFRSVQNQTLTMLATN